MSILNFIDYSECDPTTYFTNVVKSLSHSIRSLIEALTRYDSTKANPSMLFTFRPMIHSDL